MQYPSWSSTCASTWRRMENKISHVWHNYRNQIKNLVLNNKTFHIWLFHTQLTFQFRWKVNISALSTMRPIIKAIDGRKEKEQELGSDGYNHFSSGNIVVLNVQWSLLKYMTGKLKKCFSSQEIHRRPLSAKCHMKRKVTLTRSRGVCPSLFFFVASAPCLSSNFTISYLPWNEIEFSEAKRRWWSNLSSCFVQGGELPEVGHIHSGPVLHQQLGDLDRIVLVCLNGCYL